MKITIAGAGAMGMRFGLMLHRSGEEVTFIDGYKANVLALEEKGLQANYNGEEVIDQIKAYDMTAIPADLTMDLLILFTKSTQLQDMLQAVSGNIGKNTKLLCLLNGIGHEKVIEKYLPLEQVFIGTTMWTAGMEGPGRVKLFGKGSVHLGAVDKSQEAVGKEIAAILTKAGLNAHYASHIKEMIYRKASLNGCMNSLCTILEANMAEVGACPSTENMIHSIVDEFLAVAAKEDVHLEKEEILANIHSCYDPQTNGKHYPSMYQDLIKNHRLTEIDYLNGAISEKGKVYGIPTPYCDLITNLIHAKEKLLEAK